MQLKCDMINVVTTDISLATLFFFQLRLITWIYMHIVNKTCATIDC